MQDIDLSIAYLERWISWGVEPHQCHPKVVEALIKEVLRERERATKAEQEFFKKMSDLEIQRAKASGQKPGQPKYQDGVRYMPPEGNRPLGPDGFPQRGIV